MKERICALLMSLLIGALMVSPVWAESHKVQIPLKATLYGVELEPGSYKLKLEGDVGELYKGKQLLVRAKVSIEPKDPELRDYCLLSKGQLKEVGLKHDKVVFLAQLKISEPTG